jgi:ElaB/YqjD/DUF883 family membrane-anchored ribosome-binding protein
MGAVEAARKPPEEPIPGLRTPWQGSKPKMEIPMNQMINDALPTTDGVKRVLNETVDTVAGAVDKAAKVATQAAEQAAEVADEAAPTWGSLATGAMLGFVAGGPVGAIGGMLIVTGSSAIAAGNQRR